MQDQATAQTSVAAKPNQIDWRGPHGHRITGNSQDGYEFLVYDAERHGYEPTNDHFELKQMFSNYLSGREEVR